MLDLKRCLVIATIVASVQLCKKRYQNVDQFFKHRVNLSQRQRKGKVKKAAGHSAAISEQICTARNYYTLKYRAHEQRKKTKTICCPHFYGIFSSQQSEYYRFCDVINKKNAYLCFWNFFQSFIWFFSLIKWERKSWACMPIDGKISQLPRVCILFGPRTLAKY